MIRLILLSRKQKYRLIYSGNQGDVALDNDYM
jgi:hypothetical protein